MTIMVAVKNVRVAKNVERVVRVDGRIMREIVEYQVRWTRVRPGYLDDDRLAIFTTAIGALRKAVDVAGSLDLVEVPADVAQEVLDGSS